MRLKLSKFLPVSARVVLIVSLILGTPVVGLGQDTMRDFDLREGVNDENEVRIPIYTYNAVRRGGFARQNRAKEALALAIVQTAHEILARLNRSTFKLPMHPRTADIFKRVAEAELNEIYRLGLTGSTEVGPRLLDVLQAREDADDRMFIIEALARLAAIEAIAVLGRRYATEDEDCRWATLKAMSYFGGDAAMGVVRELGLADEYRGARRLAETILARK